MVVSPFRPTPVGAQSPAPPNPITEAKGIVVFSLPNECELSVGITCGNGAFQPNLSRLLMEPPTNQDLRIVGPQAGPTPPSLSLCTNPNTTHPLSRRKSTVLGRFQSPLGPRHPVRPWRSSSMWPISAVGCLWYKINTVEFKKRKNE